MIFRMWKEVFLVCALSLPSLQWDFKSDYANFRRYIEKNYPEYTVVFVHPKEHLLGQHRIIGKGTIGNPPLKPYIVKRRYQESALALPYDPLSDYSLFRKFIETRFPNLIVVYVNDREELLSRHAEKTPIRLLEGQELRVWVMKRSA